MQVSTKNGVESIYHPQYDQIWPNIIQRWQTCNTYTTKGDIESDSA